MIVTPATIRTGRAIVGGIPVVTEQQTNGNTPRVACQPLVPEGAQSPNCSSEPTLAAFAYLHVTRHAGSGQRTGGLHLAQNAVGATHVQGHPTSSSTPLGSDQA